MILELHGHHIEIIPDETNDNISVRSKNGKIQVFAPSQMPQTELSAYLTKYLKQITKQAEKSDIAQTEHSLRLFDNTYTLLIDRSTRKAYMRGKIIYVHSIPKNERQTQELQNQLLHTDITKSIGLWEERLGFLLDNITLKALPKQLFIVKRDKNQIVFSKRLTSFSLDMLNYIVAKSIFSFLQLSQESTEELCKHYIRDWKHLHRILAFDNNTGTDL
jgi:predicted metal-dependent hydrolase